MYNGFRPYILIVFILIGGSLIGGCSFFNKNEAQNDPEIETNEKEEADNGFDEEYDVIVIGGEPEGVAAAVSAARSGANTLLIERREELGGLFTYGMLNFLDLPKNKNNRIVSKGIFSEWHDLVGNDDAFGIENAKTAFRSLIDEEENITLLTNTEVEEPIVENDRITGVKITNDDGSSMIKAEGFIDATQDADFAVSAGAPYFIGGEDIELKDRKMAVTLVLHLGNVDWDGVKETAKSEKFGPAGVTDTAAWGFSELHRAYEPVESNTRLRGLNLVKTDDGYFINALQLFDVDGLDEQSIEEAIERGKKETDYILEFFQKEFKGFEHAEVISYPTELYVRETRHILAEYQLLMSDVWTNKDQWDGIAFGAYPVDIQAQSPDDYGYVVGAPNKYAIPFRSLVPKEMDGLLVVGRSTGYSSLAAGSARVVPTGMATGEAAGAAAALANEENISFREMSKDEELIDRLRIRLERQGASVEAYEAAYPYEGEWFDASIQTLMNYALINAGYDNDLHVEKEAGSHSLYNMLHNGIKRATPKSYKEIESELESTLKNILAEESKPVTRDEVAAHFVELLFEKSSDDPWKLLLEEGVIDKQLAEHISGEGNLVVKEMFALNASIINYLKED